MENKELIIDTTIELLEKSRNMPWVMVCWQMKGTIEDVEKYEMNQAYNYCIANYGDSKYTQDDVVQYINYRLDCRRKNGDYDIINNAAYIRFSKILTFDQISSNEVRSIVEWKIGDNIKFDKFLLDLNIFEKETTD